jgi:hypothetical protein
LASPDGFPCSSTSSREPWLGSVGRRGLRGTCLMAARLRGFPLATSCLSIFSFFVSLFETGRSRAFGCQLHGTLQNDPFLALFTLFAILPHQNSSRAHFCQKSHWDHCFSKKTTIIPASISARRSCAAFFISVRDYDASTSSREPFYPRHIAILLVISIARNRGVIVGALYG